MRPTWLLVALLSLGNAAPVRADGGVVVALAEQSGMRVTVFAAPVPLRAGPADLSVLVQRAADGQTLLDASVSLRLVLEGGGSPPIGTLADHEQATNRLFYAARVEIPRAGLWRLMVRVRRGDHEVEIQAPLQAAGALPPAARFWPWLAFPLVVAGVFLLHQWLRERTTAAKS